jgi:hypothetical protein
VDDVLFRPCTTPATGNPQHSASDPINDTQVAPSPLLPHKIDPNDAQSIADLDSDTIRRYLGKDANKLADPNDETIGKLNSLLAANNKTTSKQQSDDPITTDTTTTTTTNNSGSGSKMSCIIHGKRVHIDQADYNSFIKGGKWCASAFFQYVTAGWLKPHGS